MTEESYIIDAKLLEFLESDAAILLSSADSANEPAISRGYGARVSDDCKQVTVFVTEQQSATLLENVRQTGQLSLNATCVTSYESYQLKGINASISELSPKNKHFIENYCNAFIASIEKVGLTNEVAQTLLQSRQTEKSLAITFEVTGAYCQTPGPGAGEARKQI
ncbi:MAG: hypothetical protein OEW97_04140 [Gammaproteobacteria bacterium]|nr:hypothetical protein [Gammaproteobacteria bacterium]